MWTVDDEMQTFKALPYRDKLRVSRHLARGQAPGDPRMAAAAVELAESYQRQERLLVMFLRWSPLILLVIGGVGAVFDAIDGDQFGLILYALIALGGIWDLMFNPLTRPKNMARSLEASRRISSAGCAPYLEEGAKYVEGIRRADAERLSRWDL